MDLKTFVTETLVGIVKASPRLKSELPSIFLQRPWLYLIGQPTRQIGQIRTINAFPSTWRLRARRRRQQRPAAREMYGFT